MNQLKNLLWVGEVQVFLQNNSGWQELQIPRVRKDIYNESLTDPLYFVDAIERCRLHANLRHGKKVGADCG